MASSSHQRLVLPTTAPYWKEEADSDASSDDDYGDDSEEEEEDHLICLSDEEDDEVFARRARGNPMLEHVPYPDHEETSIAPDGTKWSNLPPQTSSRTIIRPWETTKGARLELQDVEAATTEEEIFKLLFTDDIIQIIVTWTNVKGEQVMSKFNQNHPDEQPKSWKPTDVVEIRAFIGLLLLTGLEKEATVTTRRLWTSDKRYKRHAFVATMSRDRFRDLSRCLRFDDRRTREARKETNKLAAMNEVFDAVVGNFRRVYEAGPEITIDEMLVKFKGHFFARVYMKQKPGRYGIKIWASADSRTRYVLKMQVYTGRETSTELQERIQQQGKSLSVPTAIMLRLLQDYYNTGRTVTADNFFGSTEAAEELMEHRLASVFTIRKGKREVPKEFLVTKGRPLHSTRFFFTRNCMMAGYKSKPSKVVLAMSTRHSDPLISKSKLKKPEVILYYNSTKGGVDTVDQMVSTYSVKRYTRRWPMKLFFQLVDVAALNSYVIRMQKNPKWESGNKGRRQIFLQNLGEQLIMPNILRRSWSGLHKDVQESIVIMGGSPPSPPSPTEAEETEPRDRRPCYECHSRVRVLCDRCQKPACPRHRMTFCNECL